MKTKIVPKDAIVTYSGKIIRPLDPDPEQICIEDIAHSLARQCRYTGHTEDFYSVAQHAVYVSELCDEKDAKWGLLHDATEVYASDLARPIKRFTEWGKQYEGIEDTLMLAIAKAFELEAPAIHALIALPLSVREADNEMLWTEIQQLMPPVLHEQIPEDFSPRVWISPLNPRDAEYEFMHRYKELF
jgi:hypothetical protein